MKTPKGAKWNRHSFDEVVAFSEPPIVPFLYYIAGTFLDVHGQGDIATEYLKLAATVPDVSDRFSVLAVHALRQKKIEVGEPRNHPQPDDWFPAFEHLLQSREALEVKDQTLARENLNKAILLRPEFSMAYIERGKFSESQGFYAVAIKDYEKVLEFNPDCEKAQLYIARLKAGCEKDDVRNGPDALALAQKAFDNRVVKAWFNYSVLAWAHAESGHFDKAVQYQKEALKLFPSNPELAFQLRTYEERKPYRIRSAPPKNPQ